MLIPRSPYEATAVGGIIDAEDRDRLFLGVWHDDRSRIVLAPVGVRVNVVVM